VSNKSFTESDRFKWRNHRAFLALEKQLQEDEKDEEQQKKEFYALFKNKTKNW
jgi:hypothetical protein